MHWLKCWRLDDGEEQADKKSLGWSGFMALLQQGIVLMSVVIATQSHLGVSGLGCCLKPLKSGTHTDAGAKLS